METFRLHSDTEIAVMSDEERQAGMFASRERIRLYREMNACCNDAVYIRRVGDVIWFYLPPERGGRFGFESLNSDFRDTDERRISYHTDAFDWVGLPIPPERG